MIAPTTFRFLNETATVSGPADWDRQDRTRLWRYNLHYFDDLVADDAQERRDWHGEYLTRWIDENPFPRGTGWEPYPCSLRITNWIKSSLAGTEFEAAWTRSLAEQAEWLSHNIEWHLLGNHLFENAKALLFAGLYFDTPESARWLRQGIDILDTELEEQVLQDGGQFELSPMYHCIVLEGVLDMLNACRCFGLPETAALQSKIEAIATRMLQWMECMLHPDDQIALFNDAAFGIATEPSTLRDYASRLALAWHPPNTSIVHLRDSGYVRAATDSALLIADVGRIGPDYLPGHAHADTLGFEFSLFGERLFVDTGCSTYENNGERLRQRGTRAHNTVIVDGQDSSEVWSSFRVASRAKPLDVNVIDVDGILRICGAHDGYQRLSGRVTHRRTWALETNRLVIDDRLSGQFGDAEASLLVPDGVEVSEEGGAAHLTLADRRVSVHASDATLSVREASWHPEFNVTRSASRIVIAFTAPVVRTIVSW